MLDLKSVVDFENTHDYRLVSPVDSSDLPVLFRLRSLNSKAVNDKRRQLMKDKPDIEGEDLVLELAASCVVDVEGDIQLPDSNKAMNPKKHTDVLKVFQENIWVASQVYESASINKNFTKG